MLCWGDPQHPNENSAEASPRFPSNGRSGGRFSEERPTCETIIIKYFIFSLSIYLFIFNFFLKECLGMRKSPLRAVFGREGGQEIPSPSPSRKPPSNHRWIFVRTCISEATVPLTKRNQEEPSSRGSLGLALPSLLLGLLDSPFGFVSDCILTFSGGCSSHKTQPSPDLYCKNVLAAEQGEHRAARGQGGR